MIEFLAISFGYGLIGILILMVIVPWVWDKDAKSEDLGGNHGQGKDKN